MTCNICHIEKSPEMFYWRNQAKGIRHQYCKECHKVIRNRSYTKHKEQIKFYSQNRRWINKDHTRKKVLEYLKTHSCEICGEADPAVLEFHHLNKKKKLENVGQLISKGATWQRIEAEIKKCRTLCANCHRRVTAKEQGWYKDASMWKVQTMEG